MPTLDEMSWNNLEAEAERCVGQLHVGVTDLDYEEEGPDLVAWMEKHLTKKEWKLLDEDIGWDDGEDHKKPGFMAFYFIDQHVEKHWQAHVYNGLKAMLKAALKAGRKRSHIAGRYCFIEKRK